MGVNMAFGQDGRRRLFRSYAPGNRARCHRGERYGAAMDQAVAYGR